ncbi:hypothetical protein [Pseudomonas sp. efr-133-TYG-5]|uniref:hypothetical protein n=1 Tax=Pseudomonas sp. efr-133-TYG-5 TaxID=3040310 RepID=UPI00255642C8|nr:hypothetical protein [Pseudomonas sp. efr-133-TYG-5]
MQFLQVHSAQVVCGEQRCRHHKSGDKQYESLHEKLHLCVLGSFTIVAEIKPRQESPGAGYREKTNVPTDQQDRFALKALIEKYLEGKAPDYQRLLEIVEQPSRQIPIRGVLEAIRCLNSVQFSQQELRLIDDPLYRYG